MSNVPTSPKDVQTLKTMVSEMTYCLEKMDAQRDHMKDIAGQAAEKFELEKKTINKMARTMYKQSYSDLCAENEHFEELYESVIEGKKVAAPVSKV